MCASNSAVIFYIICRFFFSIFSLLCWKIEKIKMRSTNVNKELLCAGNTTFRQDRKPKIKTYELTAFDTTSKYRYENMYNASAGSRTGFPRSLPSEWCARSCIQAVDKCGDFIRKKQKQEKLQAAIEKCIVISVSIFKQKICTLFYPPVLQWLMN